MRGAVWLVAVAGCSPEIAPGSYLCGQNQLCPPEQVCDGPTGTCVLASVAEPFACDPATLHEPDDTPAQARPLGALDCVSQPVVVQGCLAEGDAKNWVQFAVPGNCVTVAVSAVVQFPLAFEPLALELIDDATTSSLAVDGACARAVTNNGYVERCVTQPLTPGHSYALSVAPAGGNDCAGNCAYNRYSLTVQLQTP
jgi:hypothetical protein